MSSIDGKEKLTLVEALSQSEFDKGHIPGALRISVDEVETLAPKLLTNKAARIAVYCANTACDASPTVVKKLTSLGYTNVADYREGKADWIAAGHPVEMTTPAIKA